MHNKIYEVSTSKIPIYDRFKKFLQRKKGFYVFNRQAPEGEQLMTLDSFMREQIFNPYGSRTYWFGGILYYHTYWFDGIPDYHF